jgi:LuxR family maltose regulon positive regulatory protein
MPLFLRGDTGTFFGWLAALPADLVEARPLLCVFRAAIFMLQGDTQQYARAMRPVEALLQQESQAGGASPQVRGVLNHLTGVRVAQADLSGSPLVTIRLAEEALQSIGADPVNQVTVRLSLGHARYLLGDLAAARETWASAEAWIDPRQNPYAISLVLGHQARTSRVQGDLNAAAALYERALAGLAGNPDAVYMGLGLIEAGKADLLRERGDLAGARALAEQAMQHFPRLGGPNGLVFIHLALARVQVSQADSAGGLATLERVLPYCAHGSVYPEHREALEALRAAAWLGCGEKSRALQWAGQVESIPNPGFHDELARIAAARVRLETGSLAEALAALERLAEQSASAGRLGRLVEIEALRAAASHLQDKEDDAQAALGRALAIAAPQGWARIILEASGAIPGLLARGIRRADWPPEIIDYAKHLARLALPSHPEETATGGLVEPLSPRELEVLRLIAQGLSNNEIAARLVLSTGTVRVHTASIYRKLDVESRTQAVARARVLRLIA